MSQQQPASFIWNEPTGKGRNIFRRFQLELDLTTPVTEATLHLFADLRYRLIVNETFIGSGPARFTPSHPEYDSHDLSAHLHPGANTIYVEVCAFGTTSYQAAQDSCGGFIAWGSVIANKTVDLATPGPWKVQTLDAWDTEAAEFSFAIGPSEMVDTRHANPTKFSTPVLIKNQELWGQLQPRSVPAPSLETVRPDQLLGVYDIADTEQISGFRQYDSGYQLEAKNDRFTAYATWIHSPKEQSVDIGIFWGEHILNGKPIADRHDTQRGNRQNATFDLNPGWNLLYGEVEQLKQVWGLLLGVPHVADLQLRAQPNLDCESSLLYSKPMAKKDLPAPPTDLKSFQTLELKWNAVPVDSTPQLPARIRAWDLPAQTVEDGPLKSSIRTWVYEFKQEFDGFVTVEIDAPAGTRLDLGMDDWLKPNGLINLYGSNPFVNTVDRYILKGGPQTIQGFHVRGGHYLQLTLTLPKGATQAATVNDVHVISANCDFPNLGSFECSDPLFNWAYQTSVRTLQVSTEESYADCPWRERGTYLGDGYVNTHMHEMINTDRAIPARFLHLFAQSQFKNGQMPSAAPSWMTNALEDFTLIWILTLHDHWTLTQDTALVEELWPTLENILNSSSWNPDENGLWSADGLGIFIDWGIRLDERQGRANAALNAFRIRALDCASALADVLGKTDRANTLRAECAAVRAAYSKHLWIESESRFAASLNADGTQATTPALHANILALRYGAGNEQQQVLGCDYLVEQLKRNATAAQNDGQHSGHAEYYFLFYTLETLYQRGETEFAEQLIRDHYQPMMDANSGTLWECLCRGPKEIGSRCHSWGGAPMVTAFRNTLGIQRTDPQNPNKIRIAPQAESINWAKGTYPHALGPIRVEWKRVNGKIELTIDAPAGIEIDCPSAK